MHIVHHTKSNYHKHYYTFLLHVQFATALKSANKQFYDRNKICQSIVPICNCVAVAGTFCT